MSDLKLNLTNMTDAQIAAELRARLTSYDTNPLKTWRWWSGFICGAVIIAALDYGDVHICVGGCKQSYTSWSQPNDQ